MCRFQNFDGAFPKNTPQDGVLLRDGNDNDQIEDQLYHKFGLDKEQDIVDVR